MKGAGTASGTVPDALDVFTYFSPTTPRRGAMVIFLLGKLGHRAAQQRAQGHAMEVAGRI